MYTPDQRRVAYFSMEVGVSSKIPTYSGGLGILAGDTLKAAADVEYPLVGVTLLNKNGYFFQGIKNGVQTEMPVEWNIGDFLEPLDAEIELKIGKEVVHVGCWLYTIEGVNGYTVPLLFLDTDLEKNSTEAKDITDHLYGVGHEYRLHQEIVLGIGGVRMLKKLGYEVEKYHMNEGHAAFLTLELTKHFKDIEEVKKHCIFTTHTPVPAGHDMFDINLVKSCISPDLFDIINIRHRDDGHLNMTLLAMDHSGFINGVAKSHAKVSREMFPNYDIKSITNGVHIPTWVSQEMANLYDKHIPNWRANPDSLRIISSVGSEEIWDAHKNAKKHIIDFANATQNAGMDYDYFTIGWARRFTSYKRPDLFLENISRLIGIAEKLGPIQIIYGGKAHPLDTEGKGLLQKVISIAESLNDIVKMVYLPNYDMYVSKFATSGVDLWLNTPIPPFEASGTSGMKCALNGIPQLSILDGWWNEGCIEGETGWSFTTSNELYDLLENKIINCYYNMREEWTTIMKKTIMLNGSFFNSRRMINEYIKLAYEATEETGS